MFYGLKNKGKLRQKMNASSILFLFICAIPVVLSAQEPASVLFHANQLQTKLYANGRLSWDGEQGTFRYQDADAPMIRLGGLWIGGEDEGGNLKLAAQSHKDKESDFDPGMLTGWNDSIVSGLPIGGMNKIWTVSRDDIARHVSDFYENDNVDTIRTAIFSWPGRGNPYFEQYNGETLPEVESASYLAPFFDVDGDGIYNPQMGDYPALDHRAAPDLMAWFVFNDNTNPHDVSYGNPLQTEIQCLVYAYRCDEEDSQLNKTLFLEYTLWNKSVEPLDSAFLGLFLDFTLGCERNERLGTFPETGSIYAYEANEEADCDNYFTYGTKMVSATIIREIGIVEKDMNGQDTVLYEPFTNTIPIFEEEEGYPPGQTGPGNSAEFYSYLTGSWRDGSPLQYGGSGYEQGGTNHFNYAFPGFPLHNWEWSEPVAGVEAGHRRALASVGPIHFPPSKGNRFTLAIAVHDCYENCTDNGSESAFYDAFNEIREIKQWYRQQQVFSDPPPPPVFNCTRERLYSETPPGLETEISLYPNPTYSGVHIIVEQGTPYWMKIYNTQGQLMSSYEYPNAYYVHQDVRNWNSGVYFVQIAINGSVETRKFIVQ